MRCRRLYALTGVVMAISTAAVATEGQPCHPASTKAPARATPGDPGTASEINVPDDAPFADGYSASSGRSMGLALSGGGFRAALFHLGALRRLNDAGMLSKVRMITSVSGGSVASGFLASVWTRLERNATGRFTNFETVYEAPLRAFCGHDIRTRALLWKRLNPLNWPFLPGNDRSATDFLTDAYRPLVGNARLVDLQAIEAAGGPRFIILASNLQTGVSFHFSGKSIGDYRMGFAVSPDTSLASAMAASSSFTVAFPPLVIKPHGALFAGGIELTDLEKEEIRSRIVLTDGGVYDNLGLEPIWKRKDITTLLVSDGGKPLDVETDPGTWIGTRLMRSNDVIMNQVNALRTRWLQRLQGYDVLYWGIGTKIDQYKNHGEGYSESTGVVPSLKAVRTDFDTFSKEEQLVLMNHGWSLADAALSSCLPDVVKRAPRGPAPDADYFAPDKARDALKDSGRRVWLGR